MSTTIDQKVVSMKFDNGHFEANVKTTLSTLDKLKQSLNLKGASQGLENVSAAAKKCDLSPLSNGIETVQTKFSALQVMGVTALANITNSAVNAAKNIVSSVNSALVQGGITRAMNLENAHFQLQGLLKDEEAVTAVMKNVNDAVDGTAYSLDAAAVVASQLAASGMQAGDDMYHSLRAVAGVAAMTNSSYEEIGRIFTQVAGQGRLMGNDLLQLSSRGMNAAATIAEAMGVTEAEVRDMVSKGQISFQTFADAMDNAFGEHAKKANETFTGAMSNVKAALARIGALFVSPLIEQNGPLVQFFNTLRERINEIKKLITPFAETVTTAINKIISAATKLIGGGESDSAWSQFADKITSAGVSIDDFKTKLIEVGKEHGVITDEMIEKAGSFEKSLTSGWASVDIIAEALGSFIDSASDFTDCTEDMTEKLEYFQDIVDRVWYGEFFNGAPRIDALTEAGYDYAEVQALVNKTVDGHRLTLEDLGEEQARSIGFTEEQVSALKDLQEQAKETGTPINELINSMSKKSVKTLFLESLKNILEQISKIVSAIKKAWDDTFGKIDISSFVKKVIEGFSEWASSIKITDETLQNITDTIKGFLNAIWLLGSFLSKPIGFLNSTLKTIGYILGSKLDILTVTAYIGRYFTAIKAWIEDDNILMSSIAETGAKIKQFAVDTAKSMAQWVKDFMALPVVQEKIEAIKNAFINTGDALKEWFNGFVELFKGFIENVKSMDGLTFEGLKEQLKSFGSSIFEHFGKLGEALSNLKGAISGFKDEALSNLGPAKEFFEGFYQTIYKFFTFLKGVLRENIGFAEILTTLAGAGIIVGAVKLLGMLTKLTNAVADFLGAWAGVGKAVEKAVESLGGMFKSFGKARELEARAALIRSLAIAIGVLAASIWLIAQIPAEDLKRSCIAMAGAIAVLVGVAFLLGKVETMKLDIIAGAKVLIVLASALAILAISLAIMNNLDIPKMVVSVILLGVLMAALGTTAVLMSKYAPKLENGQAALAKGSLALLGLAASLLILSVALRIMNDMDMKNAAISVGLLIVLMGSMALLSKACEKLKFSPKVGLTMLAFSASLLIIIGAIKLLAGISTGDIIKAGVVITALFVIFGAISLLSSYAGRNSAKAGLAILGMSAALLLSVLAIKLLADVDESDMKKAAKVVAGLMLVFGAVVALSKFAGKHAARAGVMLIGMASAMLILTASLVILSHINEDGLRKGVIAIECLGAMFAALIFVTKYSNVNEHTFKSIIAMTIAIGAIAIALGVLAMIEPKRLAASTAALSIALISLAAVFVTVSHLGNQVKRALGGIIAIGIIIALLGFILYQLGNLPVESNIGNAVALGVLMLAFAGALKIISTVDGLTKQTTFAMGIMLLFVIGLAAILAVMSVLDVKGNIETAISISVLLLAMAASLKILDTIKGDVNYRTLGALAIMGAIVLELGVVLHLISMMNISVGIEQATALGILLLAMSAALVPLSYAGKMGFKAELAGIGGLALLIAAVGLILMGLGAIQKYWFDAEDFIDRGLPILEKIGYGLGSFFGNIVGGFLDAAYLDRISVFGTKLSEFMENLQPFLDSAKNISEDSVSGIKKLTEAIALICAADFMNTITSIFTGGNSLKNFAFEMCVFGEAMVEFSKIVKGNIDQEAVEAAANAGKVMAALQKDVPNSGGLLAFFAGDNSLAVFGVELSLFALGIVSFSNILKEGGGIDQGLVESAATAGSVMAALQKDLPNSGGVLAFLAGDNRLDTFGAQLVLFGAGIVAFSHTLKLGGGIDQDLVESAATAGATMAALQKDIPNTGGVVDFFTGTNNLATFGAQLVLFGAGIVMFSNTLKLGGGIDQGLVESAATAGATMAALQKDIPNTGGVVDFFTGTNNLATFGTQLALFGVGIVTFSNVLKLGGGIDEGAVQAAATAGSVMAALQKDVPDSWGVVDIFTGTNDLATFGFQLACFGAGIAKFSKAITENGGIDEGAVQAAVNASKIMLELQNGLPESEGVFEKLNKWFNGGGKDVSTLGDLFAKFGDAIKTFAGKMKEVDTTALATASSSVQTLYGIISSLDQLQYDPEKMSLLNTALTDLGGSLKSFSTNMIDFDTGSLFNASISIQTLYGILNGMTGFAADGVINFKTALDELSTISIDNFVNSFANAGPRLSAAITSMMSALTTSITSQSSVISTAFNTMLTNAASTIQGYTGSFVTAGMSLAIALGQGVSSGTSTVYSAITSVISQCTSFAASQAGTISSAGTSMMSSLAVGLQSGGPMAYAVISSVLQSCISYISGQVYSFQEGGAQLATSFADGISSNAGKAESAVENMISACKRAGDGIYDDFVDIGENAAEGFEVGINRKAASAATAAADMVINAIRKAKEAEDSNSPSKEFAKLGTYAVLGFAKGVSDNAKLASDESESMVNSALEGAKTFASKFGEAVSGDLDVQPTITPVVDMSSVNDSNIQLGANINAVLSKPIDSMSQLMSNAQAEINESNQRVVDAVNSLREDLAALYSADDQEIALYMDSRKVASTLVRPMNQQLNIALKRGGGL